MPFVTSTGSAKINHDIRHAQHDPKTGDRIQEPNNLKQLDLTWADKFDFDPNGEQYKEFVRRGQPDPTKMRWNDIPVFRVVTNRFTSGFELLDDAKEMAKTDWGRFWKSYETQVLPPDVHYEPDIEDIRVDEDKNWHFPLWVIEKLVERKEFDYALKVNKVNIPGVMKLTKSEHDRIMKEIEVRRKAETSAKEKKAVGNVSGSTKQS